jgi:hypothetical protein
MVFLFFVFRATIGCEKIDHPHFCVLHDRHGVGVLLKRTADDDDNASNYRYTVASAFDDKNTYA